jgi:hypothetical protein
MGQSSFGTVEKSIRILVDQVWNSPSWVSLSSNQLVLDIHKDLRVEVSLAGLGGSAAFHRQPDGTNLLIGGSPVYDMSSETLKDLTFVAQVAVDLFYLLEGVRRSDAAQSDPSLSKAIVGVMGPLIMFLKFTIEQRPELIQKNWYKLVIQALETAGVPLKL